MPRALAFVTVAAACAVASLVSACSKPLAEPLQLDRGILTVSNTTRDDWTSVEIWLNYHFRVTTPQIASGSRFQAPLSAFVEAYGQRFDFKRMQIRDLRLAAKTADGKPIEIKKQFQKDGLAGALERKP